MKTDVHTGTRLLAKELLRRGIPVIYCPAKRHWDGEGSDLLMAGGWPLITAADCPDPGGVDLENGVLAMVTGHGIDVIDIDSKDGGLPEHLGGMVDMSYGCTRTPSDGWHFPTPSTGYAKVNGWNNQGKHLGDYCGGTGTGGGRALAYLGGSRPKYPLGLYRQTVAWDLDRLLDNEPDDALVDLLEQEGARREGEAGAQRASYTDVDAFLHALPSATECRYGSAWLASIMEESVDNVRGRHGWLMRNAPRYVEMARSGCVGVDAWTAIVERMERMKPRSNGEAQEALAWGLSNAEGESGCLLHDPLANLGADAPADPAPADRTLDDIWTDTTELSTIFIASMSRNADPLITLGVCLAMVSTAVGPDYLLPSIIGSPASLNLLNIIVGPTGSGKSSGNQIANELLPGAQDRYFSTAPGSGEGMVAAFLGVKPDAETGQLPQIRDSVFMYADEFSSLEKQAGRQGSTILEILRSMAHGEAVGQANADTSRRRALAARSYTLGMVVGAQSTSVGAFLDEDEVLRGTPQRFLWTYVNRPRLKREDAPTWDQEALPWQPPIVDEAIRNGEDALGGLVARQHIKTYIEYPVDIQDYVWAAANAEHLTKESHSVLLRLKVAAALAMLHGRFDHFGHWEWKIAGMLMEASWDAQDKCEVALRANSARKGLARADSKANEEVRIKDTIVDLMVESVMKTMLARLERAEDGTMQKGKLKNAISAKKRKHFDDALRTAEGRGTVEIVETQRGRAVRLIG